jgi:hypothetical protein
MKNIFILILLTILFTGCEEQLYMLGIDPDVPDYDWEFPEAMGSVGDIKWVLKRNEYTYRYDEGDYWNYPHQTYENSTTGLDCEDMSILAAYLAHEILGIKDSSIVGYHNELTGGYHMMYQINGIVYQSTGGSRGNPVSSTYLGHMTFVKEWNYDEMIEEIYIRRMKRTTIEENYR